MILHIIDDDQAVARAAARIAAGAGWETMVHASADAFLATLDELPFGCVLSDIRMPGTAGTDLVAILRANRPEWPVLMMTGYGEVEAAIRCFRSGAIHFLRKPFRKSELISALQEAAEAARLRRASAERQTDAAAVEKLTKREREILSALAKGLQSKAVAWELGISVRTVEMHRSNILGKLRARNTSHAVRFLGMAAAEACP